ncbi:MAG: DUF4392 domain-containing protein [Gemmataceae bacterium]
MPDFSRLRALIQQDPGNRGLARQPVRNLLTACPDDLERSCRALKPGANLAIVTGFFIPTAQPPAAETDGPLGALFLARALYPLGIRTSILTDAGAARAFETGIRICGLRRDVPLVVLPTWSESQSLGAEEYRKRAFTQTGSPTHLLAIERVGPSHTLHSLKRQLEATNEQDENYLIFAETVPDERQDRCQTMRGIDITERMSPAHWLFESSADDPTRPATLAIGDGGNEIGMGKIPWQVIHANIPGGGPIACRIAADHLIVAGVSNWGAYALAAGVYALLGAKPAPTLFDSAMERRILERMVASGPLVDGVLGRPSVTVDGLTWDAYADVLTKCGDWIEGR